MIDLKGKTALVTGGGRGVGEAIAMVLAGEGADVAVGDIQLDTARAVSGNIEKLGRRSMALLLDVSSRKSAADAVGEIIARWEKIDILVNNAGVVSGPPGADVEATWRHVLGVNLIGVVNCTDAVLPHMADRRYGKIVNIASTAGKPGDPVWAGEKSPAPDGAKPQLGGSAYGASKAAVIRHTQATAGAVARFNINVNAVCPSRMITPMGLEIAGRRVGAQLSPQQALEARRKQVLEVNRFGRELEPVDVAYAVAFLVSDAAKNITGQSLNVDGGFKMS
ncbi:MAG: SDR family oxidoreductase [Chloroflexi bacterium]|nr:SDR family oxidoreductase [Chloroflexota bacterium]